MNEREKPSGPIYEAYLRYLKFADANGVLSFPLYTAGFEAGQRACPRPCCNQPELPLGETEL